MTRHYLVDLEGIQDCAFRRHGEILTDRPTPWKVFFASFLEPQKYGFAYCDEKELDNFLSDEFASFYAWNILRSDGDRIIIKRWSFLTVYRFCLEGLCFGTFWKFWQWTWKQEN